MRRGIQSTLVILVVVLLPLFWLLRPPAKLPARFAEQDCARVALTDTGSGQPIVGVEDMALLPDGDTLILSALDRLSRYWHPDRAPPGGLYATSLTRLAAGEGWAAPLIDPAAMPGGLAPQGIAVSDDGEHLALVNRTRDGETQIVSGGLSGGSFIPRYTRAGPEFCRANDLDFAGTGPTVLRVTLDRADCGLSWADLRPGATTGRVVSVDLAGTAAPKVEVRGLSFANGIAGLWIAETRASRLYHQLGETVPVPGGPDNLTWDGQGGLVAALHPSLMRTAAYRFGYRDSAPSRIVRVAPDHRVEVLFDDPSGDVFSGASVGILRDGTLVAGSAIDAGVMVCRKGAA